MDDRIGFPVVKWLSGDDVPAVDLQNFPHQIEFANIQDICSIIKRRGIRSLSSPIKGDADNYRVISASQLRTCNKALDHRLPPRLQQLYPQSSFGVYLFISAAVGKSADNEQSEASCVSASANSNANPAPRIPAPMADSSSARFCRTINCWFRANFQMRGSRQLHRNWASRARGYGSCRVTGLLRQFDLGDCKRSAGTLSLELHFVTRLHFI